MSKKTKKTNTSAKEVATFRDALMSKRLKNGKVVYYDGMVIRLADKICSPIFLASKCGCSFRKIVRTRQGVFFGGGESEAKNGALYAARKFLNLVKICFLK